MAPERVDFETLSRLFRKEVQLSWEEVTKMEPSFYADAEEYLRELAAEAHRELDREPSGARATLLVEEMNDARRLLEEIYERRELKILRMARSAVYGNSVDRHRFTQTERDLFDELVRLLRDARRAALRHGGHAPGEAPAPPKSEPSWPEDRAAAPVPAPAAPSPEARPAKHPEPPLPVEAAPPVAAAAPAAVAVTVSAPSVAPTREAPKTGRILVRVLEKVDPFTASDLRTYNLGADDVVALPKEAAKALVLRGKATYVTGS